MNFYYEAIVIPPPKHRRSDYPRWLDAMDKWTLKIVRGHDSRDVADFFRLNDRRTHNHFIYNPCWYIPLTKSHEELIEHKEKYQEPYKRLHAHFRGEYVNGLSDYFR